WRGVTELRNIRTGWQVDHERRRRALGGDIVLGKALPHLPRPHPHDGVVAMTGGIQLASVNFGRYDAFLQRSLFARHGLLADIFQERATSLASEKCRARKNRAQLCPNLGGLR